MITVNLIPKEILRKDRTPIGQFAAILLGVIAVVGSIVAYLYMEFGRLAEVSSELEQVHAELATVRPYKIYADNLIAEQREYTRRTETIQGIGHARVLWSKKLDQFWEVIHNDGDTDRHMVWLLQISAKSPGKGRGRGAPGSFTLAGYSGTERAEKLSNFHRDLMESAFYEGFEDINDPEGSVYYFRDDKEPNAAWRFNFSLRMKPVAKAKPKKRKTSKPKRDAAKKTKK